MFNRILVPLDGSSLAERALPHAVQFIREGKTAENIVDFAHAENIDLLVMSPHGSGGLSWWNISRVTQKVIVLVYLNVLVVLAYDHEW